LGKEYEETFLCGYFGKGSYDKKLLGLFLLDKLLLYHNNARKKLGRFYLFGGAVEKLYLDKFYFKEIKNTMDEYGL